MAQTDVRTLHPLWSASAQASGAERRSVAQALRNSAWRPDGARAVPRWHEGRSCGAAAAAALAVAFGNGLIASPALANACVASGSGFICSGDLSQGLNFNNGGKYTPGMSSSSAAGTSF
uniref:hypothetical protein n=1 Tax=Rubrimonas sp. TaxID=2036015 RepID=UPI002FDCAE87